MGSIFVILQRLFIGLKFEILLPLNIIFIYLIDSLIYLKSMKSVFSLFILEREFSEDISVILLDLWIIFIIKYKEYRHPRYNSRSNI